MAREVATDLEQHVAASINAERAAAGLAELKLEVHLNASAQGHSDWMSATGTFSHTGEDGSTATDRIGDAGFPLTGSWQTAENLAYVSIAGGLDAGELDTCTKASWTARATAPTSSTRTPPTSASASPSGRSRSPASTSRWST